MLSAEERREIEEELQQYPKRQGACIDALKIVQRHRGGWVPDEGVRDIAEVLEMSPEDVDSVATFYNLIFRSPVGRHVIRVCDSVSCWVMGCDSLIEALGKKLGIRPGGTTADQRFTLVPIQCLGTCDRAPALMSDDDLYRDLEPDQLDGILEKYS
ncbi:MAG: NADH-quinone oxidoreductase subunit NuoE [Acidobacteriota bacterium]